MIYLFATVFARSAKASLRLKRASSITPTKSNKSVLSKPRKHMGRLIRALIHVSHMRARLTCISIGREICRPLHKCGSLLFTRGDSIAADRRNDAGIRQGRARCDNRVCYEVVDGLKGENQYECLKWSWSPDSTDLKIWGDVYQGDARS